MNPTVLIVDDEALIRWSLKANLTESNHEVIEAATGAEALRVFDENVDLVLLDHRLPDASGLDLLRDFKARAPDTPVILITAYASVENAVEAIKLGAYHYVNKPFNVDEVRLLVDKALETSQLRREVRVLRASQKAPYALDRIIGVSPAMRAIKALLAKVAASPASTVLLTGETGTGKDLAAKTIHFNSDRATRPFVNITCSALPETLLESELFGHERGAFTDARQQKKGLFETAHGGTVFLDEIGEMTPTLQAKILRFLEDKAFKRVGGLTDVRVDVRVIAATHRDLDQSVREGRFREDLFYRLMVMPVSLPPLRDRPGDVPLLVQYYVAQYNAEFRKNVSDVSPAALRVLEAYPWPGNVRELRNAVERAMLLAEQRTLTPELFDMLRLRSPVHVFALPAEGIDFHAVERDFVVQALQRAAGNQTRAGALLGMNRDQIRYRLEKFGLRHDLARDEPQ